MPLSNAERQKRFRELTLKERELKADAFDLLIAFIEAECVPRDDIPLTDGRSLMVTRRNGEVSVELANNPELQQKIKQAHLSLLYEN